MAEPGDTESVEKRPLFRDLGAQIDLDELEVSEIQSLCMNCQKNVMQIKMSEYHVNLVID